MRFRKTPGLGKRSSTPARPSLKRPTRRLSFRTGAPAPGTSALLTAFWPFFNQAGGSILNENGEVDFNTEAALQTVQFLKDLYDAGIFDESITAETDMAGKFNAGEVAFYCVGDTSGINSATKNGINYGLKIGLKGPAGIATRGTGDSYAVAAKAVERGNEELAVKALLLMNSAEVQDDFHNKVYAFPNATRDAQARVQRAA